MSELGPVARLEEAAAERQLLHFVHLEAVPVPADPEEADHIAEEASSASCPCNKDPFAAGLDREDA